MCISSYHHGSHYQGLISVIEDLSNVQPRLLLAVTNHLRLILQDDVIKWKHFPRYWPSVPGIHQSPVNSPHKGQWRGALMFSFICTWTNSWVNNREASDLNRHRDHYDVIVMMYHQMTAKRRVLDFILASDHIMVYNIKWMGVKI